MEEMTCELSSAEASKQKINELNVLLASKMELTTSIIRDDRNNRQYHEPKVLHNLSMARVVAVVFHG